MSYMDILKYKDKIRVLENEKRELNEEINSYRNKIKDYEHNVEVENKNTYLDKYYKGKFSFSEYYDLTSLTGGVSYIHILNINPDLVTCKCHIVSDNFMGILDVKLFCPMKMRLMTSEVDQKDWLIKHFEEIDKSEFRVKLLEVGDTLINFQHSYQY